MSVHFCFDGVFDSDDDDDGDTLTAQSKLSVHTFFPKDGLPPSQDGIYKGTS